MGWSEWCHLSAILKKKDFSQTGDCMGVRADDILKDNQLIPHGLQFRRRVPLVAIQGKMIPIR